MWHTCAEQLRDACRLDAHAHGLRHEVLEHGVAPLLEEQLQLLRQLLVLGERRAPAVQPVAVKGGERAAQVVGAVTDGREHRLDLGHRGRAGSDIDADGGRRCSRCWDAGGSKPSALGLAACALAVRRGGVRKRTGHRQARS
eukprot:scaffold32170_cov38-Phaeocystis_antarctica.AAC.4